MPRQPFVEERIVRAQQLRQWAILAYLILKKKLGLASHGFAQRWVEVRESPSIRCSRVNIAHLKPLLDEVVQETRQPPVREHAVNLLLNDDWIAELPLLGEPQQFLIGDASPQEER